MKRIMFAVLVAYVLAVASLVGQQGQITLSAEQADRLRIMTAPTTGAFVIYGTDSPKPAVVIHQDGRVEYSASLDAASKTFWEAVEAMGYTRECKSGEKPKEPEKK